MRVIRPECAEKTQQKVVNGGVLPLDKSLLMGDPKCTAMISSLNSHQRVPKSNGIGGMGDFSLKG
jgi:hypothetical protein